MAYPVPNYRGLSPEDALTLYGQTRQAIAQQYGIDLTKGGQSVAALPPGVLADFGMDTLAQQNPAAWQLLKTGKAAYQDPTTGQTMQDVYNANTGGWSPQEVKGYWSNPESWIQLGAGAGLAGVGIAGALGGAAPAASSGPLASGYGGATTAASVPASLAAPGGGGGIMASLFGGGALTTPGAQVLSTGLGSATNLFGAKKQSDAALQAAQLQTDAATKAAELQAQSAANALDFTKQQAAQARVDADVTQHANYDQWVAAQQYQNAQQAARTASINALGAQYGVAPRAQPVMTIPAYRSTLAAAAGLPDPGAGPTTGTGSSAGPAAPAAPASGNPMDPAYIGQQLAALYGQYGLTPTGPGSGPTDSAYMTQKILDTGGWQGDNAAYWSQRIPAEIALARGGGSGVAPGQAGTIGAALPGTPPPGGLATTTPAGTPAPITTTTPALQVAPYQRRTVQDYLR
jgi:hypothetical protein